MSNVERNIGGRVAGLRRGKGLTQAQLAEMVDVATETISRLERGVSMPSLKTLENIARFLDVPLKALFDFERSRVLKRPHVLQESHSEKGLEKIVVLLKYKKAEDIRLAHTVLKGLFHSIKKHNLNKR